jgi:hypothetical protein
MAIGWNRHGRSIDRLNLLYASDMERIHAIGRTRSAGPSDHDPL